MEENKIGTIDRFPLCGFEIDDHCVIYKKYLLKFKQDGHVVESFDLETGVTKKLELEEEAKIGDFKWVRYWKEDRLIFCGEAIPCQGNYFRNPIRIVSVVEENGLDNGDLKFTVVTKEIEMESAIAEFKAVQVDQDYLYLENQSIYAEGRIHLGSMVFERLFQPDLKHQSLFGFFCQNTYFSCEKSQEYEQGTEEFFQTKFTSFNLDSKEIKQSEELTVLREFSSLTVVGTRAYLFSENWKVCEFNCETLCTRIIDTLSSLLPSGKFNQMQSENKVLRWEAEGKAKEAFLLAFDNGYVNEIFNKGLAPKMVLPLMKKLFEEKTFADVTFLVENTEIPAHRNILIQSKFFENMFKSGMQETTAQKIPISDISAKAFQAILETIYCGTVTLDGPLAMELIVQADKYGLDELKAACETELLQHVNMNNLVKLTWITEKTETPRLEKKVADFFAENASKIETGIKMIELPQKMLMKTIVFLTQKQKFSSKTVF